MEELVDIYDKNRNRTGITIPRAGARMKEGQYLLYTLAIVENLEGKYLITQRAMDKGWGAGWWEISGGGVLSGESTIEACVREVGEEVGLDVSNIDPVLALTYENVDLERGSNYFNDIYHFTFDFNADDVTLQESEAVDFKLASWDEIVSLHEQGIFLHFERVKQALHK